MKKYLFKCIFSLFVLTELVVFFVACGDNTSSTSSGDDCPENYICDTNYTDVSAYSFVYYVGKDSLDTVTATTDRMTCDIEDDNFHCSLMFIHGCFSYSYSVASANGTVKDSAKHLTVNVTRVDTTYINYGKKRLIDYVPAYVEVPKLSEKKLQDLFDTLILKPYDSKYYSYYGHTDDFLSNYYIEGKDLPDGFGVSSYTGRFATLLGCGDTTYTNYPLIPKDVEARLYMFLEEPLEKDTTITWMAYYTDMYGVEDSLEVTTFVTMEED